MKIGAKILAGFTAVTALTIGVGWYSLAKQGEVRVRTGELVDRDLNAMGLIRQLTQKNNRLLTVRHEALARAAMRKAGLRAEDPAGAEEQYRRVKDQSAKLLAALESSAAEYQKTAVTPERAVHWGRMRQTAHETRQALDEMVAEVEIRFQLMTRGDGSQMIARTPAVDRLRAALESKTESLAQEIEQQTDLGQRQTPEIYEQARFSTLAAVALAVLLGAGAGG